jgi:flagellar hook-associated protein 2
MATIQFGGLITGLNTNALIQGLVQAEQGPINILQGRKTVLQAQQGVYTTLVSGLATLQSAAQSLSLSSDFNQKSATSSDASVLTVSADSTAQVGSNAVVVDTLAKAQSIESVPFTSASDGIGTGTLTIHVGGTTTPITIDATNKTLTGLQTAINSSGAGVTASIVNLGTKASPDYRLILQSKNTGTENAVTVTGTLSGGTDPFAGGGTVVQAAADAVFSVNGLTVTRSSNQVSDIIPGVTFTLLKEGNHDDVVSSADASANISVALNNSGIQSSIQSFVDAYNAVNKIVSSQFSLDPTTSHQGVLAGDAALRGVMSRLRNELSVAGGNGAGFTHLSDIGVRFQDDGSLTLDAAKLNNALDTNSTGVANLFALVKNGIGKRIPDAVDSMINPVNGSLTAREQGIQARISNIDQQVADEQQRLTVYQSQLTQQFAAMEQMISQMQSQGNFLTQTFTPSTTNSTQGSSGSANTSSSASSTSN